MTEPVLPGGATETSGPADRLDILFRACWHNTHFDGRERQGVTAGVALENNYWKVLHSKSGTDYSLPAIEVSYV